MHGPAAWNDEACDLVEQFQQGGDLPVIDKAIALFSKVVQATRPDDLKRPMVLSNVGYTHLERFKRTGSQADLDEAIRYGQQAVEAAQAGHPDRDLCLTNLASAYFKRFERTRSQTDLETAIRAHGEAVEATPAGHGQRAARLSNLAVAHWLRYEQAGAQANLEAAIQYGREAVQAPPGDHPDRPRWMATLGLAYCARFEQAGSPADLEAAIRYAREAMDATSADDPDRASRLNNAGVAYRLRFERAGVQADLEAAIRYAREAVDASSVNDPGRAVRLSNAGVAYRQRFERAGAQADLEAAIRYAREAVDTASVNDPDRGVLLSNLAAAHLRRFEYAGAQADLEAAIGYGHQAVDATPADHPNRARRQSVLVLAYRLRFESAGAQADLDAAIQVGREAVQASPANDRDRGAYLSNLGLAYRQRSEWTGAQADLDAAIQVGREAIQATPADRPDLQAMLNNLSLAYRERFERTGSTKDSDEAIRYGQQALDATPADHPMRARRLSNLGAAYRERFERTGSTKDSDEAIRYGQQALDATPAKHPDRASMLFNLGATRQSRFERFRSMKDLDQAIRSWREATSSPVAATEVRMRAARAWGNAAAAAGHVAAAAEGYAEAVHLLPILAWRGLQRSLREEHLTSVAGLACEAAAWAIEANRPEQAVELLEQGRSILWSQLLQTRTDTTALRQQRPDLADRLDDVRIELDRHDRGPHSVDSEAAAAMSPDTGELEEATQRQHRLAEEWDDLIEQVRQLDGFRTFLAPTPFDRLCQAAAEGPVVLVNVSNHRCDALIITSTGVQVCPLPAVTIQECVRRTIALLQALYPTWGMSPAAGRVSRVQVLFDLQEWLWDAICQPVLDELDRLTAPGPQQAKRRVWWCPTGPLTMLPIHAAGHYRDASTARCLPDLVISSYTPTLTALLRTRDVVPSPSQTRLLVVGMPTTPDANDLPAVPAELRCIADRIPVSTLLRSATRQEINEGKPPQAGSLPTVQRVLSELADHDWAHFACHGGQDLAEPAHGALFLYDGPLSILRIAAQELPHADLAFLSACQTAVGGAELLDEAIHLAAAVQLAGYRHVIATLWSISDTHAPDIADAVYTELTVTGEPSTANVALAVHKAAAALRASQPLRPDLWAAYLHVGP
jgi:hypothetical protein